MGDIEDLSNMPVRVNLRKDYPLARRIIIRRSLGWIFWGLGVVIVIAIVDRFVRGLPQGPGTLASDTLQFLELVIVLVVTLAVLGKLLYEALYFTFYYYAVEADHLVITKGLLFRARVSVPIAKINDVTLHRDPVDLIFQLYDIRIMTPSPMADLTTIDGVSTKTAVALQTHLLALVETTLPEPNLERARDMIEEQVEAEG